MDGAFVEPQPLVNRLQEQEMGHINATKRALASLFQTETGSLREVIQEFLACDEAVELTKKDVQKAAAEWARAAVMNGHPDPRVRELHELLLRFREEGGSLGVWAYEELPTPADSSKESLSEKPTRETLGAYLEETQGKIPPDIKIQAIFESLVERAKTAKELQSNIQLNTFLQNLSPQEVAREYTAFLVAHEDLQPFYLEVWKILVRQAKKQITLKEVRAEQVEWQNRMEDPDYTWAVKRNLINFLLNAPGEGYLGSQTFEEDVAEYLQKRAMRTNRYQLPGVLDQIEGELRAQTDRSEFSLEEQLRFQQKVDALNLIRAQALLAFGRSSSPEQTVQLG